MKLDFYILNACARASVLYIKYERRGCAPGIMSLPASAPIASAENLCDTHYIVIELMRLHKYDNCFRYITRGGTCKLCCVLTHISRTCELIQSVCAPATVLYIPIS